ncbi:hypothetical protein [Streptomyces sp. NRRL S-87]|uniref:hypothetical protein n=1 Tax=Streptomyces sp. NRRL S-87 TaxID=1463920 RepID=UPI00068A8A9A|nr:hypothetical protein [Streptomyces sp. NRRL S-87]
MTENDVELTAIAALTAARSGAGTEYVSDLLEEAIPKEFQVPVGATAEEAGVAVLEQLSEPLSGLVTGFLLAFDALADAHDGIDPPVTSEEVLQQLALALAREASG